MSITSKLTGEGGRPCSASVEYKDRQGPCQKDGKYPDPDGVRWWCGLHNPDRPRARVVPDNSPRIDKEVLLGIRQVDSDREEMIRAMEEVLKVLVELSDTRDTGWPPNTPVDKYKIMMAHMADRAAEARHKLSEQLSRFKS
jgi:hypothetical protein